MWTSAYVWAYLFRIDICKDKILNSENLYNQIARVLSDTHTHTHTRAHTLTHRHCALTGPPLSACAMNTDDVEALTMGAAAQAEEEEE